MHRKDREHIDFGGAGGQCAFHGNHAPAEERDIRADGDFMLFYKIQKLLNQISQAHLAEVQSHITADDIIHVRIEPGMINAVFWLSQGEEDIFQRIDVVH